MIEWKKYDPSNPPPEKIKFIVYNNQGEIEIGEIVIFKDDDYLEWIGDQHFQEISNVTHYAEINLPESNEQGIKEGTIYVAHDIGKSEITVEHAKKMLEDHESGKDKLPPNMVKILKGMIESND